MVAKEKQRRSHCVALSVADIYCTGWAGWKGDAWSVALDPWPCSCRKAGGHGAPCSWIAAYIQRGRLQCARQGHTCMHTPMHTSIHLCIYTHTHTGTLISHTVRAFPGLQASRAQCCSMPVAALVLSSLGSSSRAAWLRSPQPQSLAGMGAAESAGACCTSDPITYLHSLAVTPRHGAVGRASAGPHA